MTRDVRTISPAAQADEAWNLMRVQRIHHLVVAKGRHVVGILSDRDIGGRQGGPVRKNRTVEDLMTADVVTVPPATTVRKAANVMRGRAIGCLVVATSGRPVGIVTVADLLELIGRGLERPVAESKRRAISHRVPHRPRSGSAGAW